MRIRFDGAVWHLQVPYATHGLCADQLLDDQMNFPTIPRRFTRSTVGLNV